MQAAKRPEFIDQQYDFAAYIRNPEQNAAPDGIETRRMAIYRDLFYNNIENFAASAFPVIRAITSDERWHAMIRDFMVKHHCKTPLFLEIAQELLDYLQNEREPQADDYPFLLELAHYEWVELALSISEESAIGEDVDPNGDLITGIPQLSPLAWPLSYHYPVHRIGPEQIPDGETETHLVVYRDRHDAVHFLEINAVTARLLQLIQQNVAASGRELLESIATEMNHPQPQQIVSAGAEILLDLRHRDLLTGIHNIPER